MLSIINFYEYITLKSPKSLPKGNVLIKWLFSSITHRSQLLNHVVFEGCSKTQRRRKSVASEHHQWDALSVQGADPPRLNIILGTRTRHWWRQGPSSCSMNHVVGVVVVIPIRLCEPISKGDFSGDAASFAAAGRTLIASCWWRAEYDNLMEFIYIFAHFVPRFLLPSGGRQSSSSAG